MREVSFKTFVSTISILLFVIIASKSLIPHFDKPWFNELRKISKEKFLARPILLTNEPDMMLAYYLKSEIYIFNTEFISLTNSSDLQKWNK